MRLCNVNMVTQTRLSFQYAIQSKNDHILLYFNVLSLCSITRDTASMSVTVCMSLLAHKQGQYIV